MRIKDFIQQHKHLLIILLVAALLRAIFMGAILYNFGDKGFYPSINEDSEQYWQLAKNLVEHNIFSLNSSPPFIQESFRTPGYPFFISIFYRIIPAAWFIIIFQNIIALISISLIYKISKLLFNKRFIALLSALIYAVEPAVIYWNNQLLSETLFVFFLLLSVYLFVKYIFLAKRYLLSTGLILGGLLALASYTRTVAQFIIPIFIIFSLSFKNINQRIALIFLMVASFFVLSGPWLIRNKALINAYDFSGASKGVGFRRHMNMVYINLGGNAEDFQNDFPDRARSTTIKYLAKHPLAFGKLNFLSSIPFLMSDSYFTVASTIYPSLEKQRVIVEWTGSWDRLKSFLFGHQGIEWILFFGGKVILLTLNLFAFAGVVFWARVFKKNRIVISFFTCLIYYFILASGVTAYSRLRQPVNPYIFILAAAGIYWLWDAKIKKYFAHG